MPGRGTPQITLRLPDELWDRFGEAAERAGADRSALLRAFIRWYVRDQDAKLPPRPGATA